MFRLSWATLGAIMVLCWGHFGKYQISVCRGTPSLSGQMDLNSSHALAESTWLVKHSTFHILFVFTESQLEWTPRESHIFALWERFAVALEAFPVVDTVFSFTVDRVSDFVVVVGKKSRNLRSGGQGVWAAGWRSLAAFFPARCVSVRLSSEVVFPLKLRQGGAADHLPYIRGLSESRHWRFFKGFF